MKVLLSAYSCYPDRGSEPGVGWNWAKQTARFHEVWVLTRTENREAIEAELAKNPVPNLHFEYYDLPKWLTFWRKWRCGNLLYYYLWQKRAHRVAAKLHGGICFDVAHHVTFMNPAISFVQLLGIPSVVGPFGGLESSPKYFNSITRHFFFEGFRNLRIRLMRLLPSARCVFSRAALLLPANHGCLTALSRLARTKSVVAQVGVRLQSERSERKDSRESVSIYWGGVFKGWKGLELGLRALSRIRNGNIVMRITGDGPDNDYFESVVRRLGIGSQVSFLGWIERSRQQQVMAGSDIFLFTSLHETTGVVLMEAMSYGLPVVVVDWGGPSDIVTADCGIKVKPRSVAQVVGDMAAAIERLARDPELRLRMGEAGRKRVAQVYDWNVKGKEMARIYKQAAETFDKRRGR